MRLWSLLYAISLLISTIAAGAIASSIYRHSELRVSAVRFIFFFFFFYLWLWSLFRATLYMHTFLVDAYTVEGEQLSDNEAEYVDALGVRQIAQIKQVTTPWLSFIIVMGDTALMASSLWMFPMTFELTKLARLSMDRGITRERLVVRSYSKWMHVFIAFFFVMEASYTVWNHGFNSNSYRVLISGNMIQAVALVYVTYILIHLKWTGRKYETIHGAHVASPLYKRIKGIMIVYGIFSFQYQLISLILLCSHFDVHMPTVLVGASALLFNNSGTALSIAIGCSQECFFRSCSRYVPEEYTSAFYVSDPQLALANAAKGYSPPVVNPVFVFTDIESSTQLWGFEDGAIMRRANEIHEEVIRSSLAQFRGYEITTCGDAFQLAFHTVKEAVEYCMQVQFKLLQAHWPKKLHNLIPATAREKTKTKKLVFSGLRVRMGIHDAQEVDGVLVKNLHPVTGKVTYTGISEVIANEIVDVGAGGQICVTRRVAEWLNANRSIANCNYKVEFLGQHRVPQVNIVMDVYELTPQGLEPRKKSFEKHWQQQLQQIQIVE